MNIGWWEKKGLKLEGKFLSHLVLSSDSQAESRIQRIRNYLLEAKGPKISIARAVLFTEAYRKHEKEPVPIRKAKAFYHVMQNIPIPLIPGQLLVGTPASFYGAIELDPEYYTGWLLSKSCSNDINQLQNLPTRNIMPVDVSQSDLKVLEDEILPFWEDICLSSHIWKELHASYPQVEDFINESQVFMTNFGKGFSHTIQDYKSVATKGLRYLKAEIGRQRDAAAQDKLSDNEIARFHMYEAMLICADALICYANRCADLCEQALNSTDAVYHRELKAMAEICRKVPEFPAESWQEALQAIHFAHMATFLTDAGVSHSLGRMDYYLYPLYRQWVGEGAQTPQEAQELLECFYLKCYEYQSLRDEKTAMGLAGDRTNDKITLGGLDENGFDITNDLTYRFLEACAHVHLKEPNISLRVHKNSPEDLILSALEVVRLGSGLPQFINDDVIIDSLMTSVGVDLKDARNYADIGCQENVIDPNNSPSGADSNGHNNAGFFNLVKVLELALYNGTNQVNQKQVGPLTGDTESFVTMDEFIAAFIEQLKYAIGMNVSMNKIVEYHYANTFSNPYLNLMHPGPRKSGLDYVQGGCRYNWVGAVGVGLATLADSLMVIEEMIFNKKKCSWKQMLSALQSDWKGYESLRDFSLSLPRYGASGKRAQFWARWLTGQFSLEYEKYSLQRGPVKAKFVIGLFSMGIYLPMGKDVSATPDGRFAGQMLSGSVAPSVYASSDGYTATHNAASGIHTEKAPNGIVFNQVMPFNIVSRHVDLEKWAVLLRTYFELGGMSVQYSVVNRDELKIAQKHPDLYKDLIVRVGGYSARFVDLSREIQDEFIARTC